MNKRQLKKLAPRVNQELHRLVTEQQEKLSVAETDSEFYRLMAQSHNKRADRMEATTKRQVTTILNQSDTITDLDIQNQRLKLEMKGKAAESFLAGAIVGTSITMLIVAISMP